MPKFAAAGEQRPRRKQGEPGRQPGRQPGQGTTTQETQAKADGRGQEVSHVHLRIFHLFTNTFALFKVQID